MDSDSDISDNLSDQVDVSNKRYLLRTKVAEIFDVHPQTITNWIDRGLLSGMDIYGRTFVDIRSVERLQSEFSDVVDMEKKWKPIGANWRGWRRNTSRHVRT